MKLNIPYTALRLINYEGAGNKTPVLDLRSVKNIALYPKEEVRTYLEQDRRFRIWLQHEGRRLYADSVMLFYKTAKKNYEFVAFIGEPNTDITNSFSTMCGNGIRSLALHIFFTEKATAVRKRYLKEGIRIWAGAIKTLSILSVNELEQRGIVRVTMGPFRNSQISLHGYTNGFFRGYSTLSSVLLPKSSLPERLQAYSFGIGYNGEDDGEPHVVLVIRWEQYLQLLKTFAIASSPQSNREVMHALRSIVCTLGRDLTFATDLFPRFINFNLGVVLQDTIFMSTHERNLSPNRETCLRQQERNIFCQCNTLACGTGGAVVANIARIQGIINSSTVTTVHPGGELTYTLSDLETFMVGPARKVGFSK